MSLNLSDAPSRVNFATANPKPSHLQESPYPQNKTAKSTPTLCHFVIFRHSDYMTLRIYFVNLQNETKLT